MNRLKLGVLPLVLAVTTHLVASPIATASPKSEKTSQVVLQSVGSQRVLFVVSADDGWVQKKGSDYTLSMQLNGIKQIIVFTDRPARLVKYIQKQGLKQAWYAKDVTHNFSENAPNAVLSSQNAKPSVITITHMHMHGSTVHFVFHLIKPGMFSIPVGKIHEVTLTIDKASTSTTSTSKLSTGSIIGITAGSLAAAGGAAGATVATVNSIGSSAEDEAPPVADPLIDEAAARAASIAKAAKKYIGERKGQVENEKAEKDAQAEKDPQAQQDAEDDSEGQAELETIDENDEEDSAAYDDSDEEDVDELNQLDLIGNEADEGASGAGGAAGALEVAAEDGL